MLRSGDVSYLALDIGGLNATLVEDASNFTLLGSGGDGIFGNGNDVDRSSLITQVLLLNLGFGGAGKLERIRVDLENVPDDGERYQLLITGNVADADGCPLVYAVPFEFDADQVRIPDSNTPHSLLFDGIDDVVTTPLNIDQSATSPGITFEAWVFPTSTSSGRHEVISSDNGGFDWSILREGATWFVFTGSGSSSTGFSVDLNVWQHLAAVFNPATGSVDFYKNGQKATITALGFDTSDADIAIGRRAGGTTEFFAGNIDEVRVWNAPRTQSEILSTIQTTLAGNEANLAAYWRMNEGTGTATDDASVNANIGTLGGGVTSREPQWSTVVPPLDAGVSTRQWISDVDGAWENPANWADGIVP